MATGLDDMARSMADLTTPFRAWMSVTELMLVLSRSESTCNDTTTMRERERDGDKSLENI